MDVTNRVYRSHKQGIDRGIGSMTDPNRAILEARNRESEMSLAIC